MYLGAVGADVPTQQRTQIGDAVDAAGIALLADDQDGQHRGQRLGDDGEVDAADAALEHCGAENEGEDRGTAITAMSANGRTLNGTQKYGSSVI